MCVCVCVQGWGEERGGGEEKGREGVDVRKMLYKVVITKHVGDCKTRKTNACI
jgi:hypothetical protein